MTACSIPRPISYANFAQNQGSFLVGVLGAAMADKGSAVEGLGDGKAIGFVGGRDIPVIRDFLAGYEQGAKYGAPDVRVDAVFAGTFDDPAKGSELTMALYGQGSDMVYNVAGPTGEGVLQASAAAGKYSFGVDIDQCPVAPGHVMASMLKHADVAVYSLIKDVVDGKGVAPGADLHLRPQDRRRRTALLPGRRRQNSRRREGQGRGRKGRHHLRQDQQSTP